MLTSLKIENFRGFELHEVPLRELSIIVGKNNAGKSTIVEALRLISIVVSRYKNLTYYQPPDWLEISRGSIGVSPSLKNLEINFDGLYHRYSEPPAIITATFENGYSVIAYLGGNNEIHSVIKTEKGKLIKSKEQAARAKLGDVLIMPQVAPLLRDEPVRNEDYVKSLVSSSLSPLHFRNQLYIMGQHFDKFKELVELSWPGVKVVELASYFKDDGVRVLALQIRNEDFVGEAASMGHGLQMWLQTIWFLARANESSVIILDEPDVYMHADLQRRLIKLIRNKYNQIIVATHSIEIMSEVEAENILIVDRKKKQSRFAETIPVVQDTIDKIGGIHNIHLARLAYSSRLILVEGEDIYMLKKLHHKLFQDSLNTLDSLPNMDIGGWSGWPYAIGSSMVLKNALNQNIVTYCILDRDYHTEAQIQKRLMEAAGKKICLKIWGRKEIENYLIVPSLILRFIEQKVPKRVQSPTLIEVEENILRLANSLEDQLLDSLATELWQEDRAIGQAGANRRAREVIRSAKLSKYGIVNSVSGKELLSLISNWSQSEFGVSISLRGLIHEINVDEMDDEIVQLLTAIEKGNPL